MTAQEYYDLLVCSALDGTFPSVTNSGSCRYNGGGCHRCAVGILLPPTALAHMNEGVQTGRSLSLPLDPMERENNETVRPFVPRSLTLEDISETQLAHDTNIWERGEFVEPFLENLNQLSWVREQVDHLLLGRKLV